MTNCFLFVSLVRGLFSFFAFFRIWILFLLFVFVFSGYSRDCKMHDIFIQLRHKLVVLLLSKQCKDCKPLSFSLSPSHCAAVVYFVSLYILNLTSYCCCCFYSQCSFRFTHIFLPILLLFFLYLFVLLFVEHLLIVHVDELSQF